MTTLCRRSWSGIRYFGSLSLIVGGIVYNPTWGHELAMPLFLPPSAPLLSRPVVSIPEAEIPSHDTQQAIDRMYAIAATKRTAQKMQLVGLAAPQVGIDKAIILVDVGVNEEGTKWGELKAYLNPKIIWYSAEVTDGREGCFSIDHHVVGVVPRAERIKVTAFDRYGTPIAQEFAGYTARIFQHEIDHLKGIRFPERVGETGTLHWVEGEQYPDYRFNWRTWPTRCPWSTWLNMKEGKPISAPH